MSLRNNSSYWGMEVLPSNASLSAFSSFSGNPSDSHFFPPGASGFSFEGSPAGGGIWDGSYRTSATSSPSLFGDTRPPTFLLRQATNESSPLNPRTFSSDGGSVPSAGSQASQHPVQLWDLPQSSASRAYGSSTLRTSSPVGGGRKPKDASRRLRFPIATVSRDKGLVGLAKPPRENPEQQGRVAVAGKTCLKLLKVPHGASSRTASAPSTAVPSPMGSYHSSSIAARRSRSRGSPAPIRDASVGRIDEDKEGEQREDVIEMMDVRLGSRLGPAYLFSDVRWGYGATSNKLATSFTNGAVVLWDLAKEGGSRLEQLKYEHDRAVNRVVFGGQTGNWLMSGGQDGQMKLWDIREARPANMVLKASSPVRHLSFSPSASQPFTLVAACASGTLIRYDVRYISRQNGGATDRVAGHIGACLAMDWRDGFSCERNVPGAPGSSAETAGGGREGGWVVTGGVDRTIKIWDFSLATLSTKPVRTMYTSQPVSAVAWHPTRATELVSCPMPSLGLGGTGEGSASSLGDEPPTTPVTPGDPAAAAFIKGEQPGRQRFVDGNAWKNEIEVWDVRRPYFPKVAIKTEEPTAALLWNDDETVWSTSKTTPTFSQHDVAADSYSLLDSIDRPAPTWSVEGDMAFLDDGRKLNDIPFERPSRSMPPVDSVKFRPDAFVNTVANLDPEFSIDSFAYLANNLELTGNFGDVCTHNAQVCMLADRADASQVWMTVRAWFDDDEHFFPPDSPPPTPSPPPEVHRRSSGVAIPSSHWPASPNSATGGEMSSRQNGSTQRSGRPSFSSVLGSRRSSADATPQLGSNSSSGGAADSPGNPNGSALTVFTEESTASETEPSEDHDQEYPELNTTSSDSEHELVVRARKLNLLNPTRLAASLGALREKGNRRSRSRSSTVESQVIADDEQGAVPSRPLSRHASRRNSSSSSSGSDLDEDERAANDGMRRSRSAKIASMHASIIANRSRRPSSGAGARPSTQRRPLRSRESTLPRSSSRQQSLEGGAAMSRRGSLGLAVHGGRLRSLDRGSAGSTQRRRGSQDVRVGPSAQNLQRRAGEQHAADAREIVMKQLKATLQEYADRGDSQLCATVCCVLRDKTIEFDSLWVARVTKTYIDLLRRLRLHVPAAHINKYCTDDTLQGLTQNTVVVHVACGSCGKAVDQAPFGFCSRCSSQVTKCCICHLSVRSLYVFCASCGHGAHASCLDALSSSISSGLASSLPQTPHDASHPSTPGIGTPVRAWLWGESEEADGIASSPLGEDEPAVLAKNLRDLLSSCPAACGCRSCSLMTAV
ncbi:SEA (Seh1-associated) complex subunit [Rhodotorula kratochvilovae]